MPCQWRRHVHVYLLILYNVLQASAEVLTLFQTWLVENGAECSHVSVREAGDGRRGLFATKLIPRGTAVIRLPHRLLLTPRHSIGRLVGCHNPAEIAFRLNNNAGLAVALLVERHHQRIFGNASLWKPALDILPETFEAPRSWPAKDLALLKGTTLLISVSAQLKGINNAWKRLAKLCPVVYRFFTVSDWHWAMNTVLSRSFQMRSKSRGEIEQWGKRTVIVAMVPLVDLANHHEYANTTWEFRDGEDAFVMLADADIPEGVEVFDSYGNKDATAMFETYGFIPAGDVDSSALVRNSRAQSVLELPLCVPPSTMAFHNSGIVSDMKRRLFNISMPPCCAEGEEVSDRDCFMRILSETSLHTESFFVVLSQFPTGSEERSNNQLVKALAHFRFLVLSEASVMQCFASQMSASAMPARTIAEWSFPCEEHACWPEATTSNCVQRLCFHLLPINAETEHLALGLLRDLLEAHLAQTSWVERDEVDLPTGSGSTGASKSRRAIARRYLLAERETLRWNAQMLAFVQPLLKVRKEEIREEVCRLASPENQTARQLVRDSGEYIDTVVAPLAFLATPEGAPCSVASTRHAITRSCIQQELGRKVINMIDDFRQAHRTATLEVSSSLEL